MRVLLSRNFAYFFCENKTLVKISKFTALSVLVNPCHAEFLYVLHSFPILILLTYSIPVVSMYFQSKWKMLWILIRWLHKKPADQDLQYFQERINPVSTRQGLIQFQRFRACLFIDALWSPAGKGLTSWLSFVMSNCEVVTGSGMVLYCIDSWSLPFFLL